jgi:hypothetical protein
MRSGALNAMEASPAGSRALDASAVSWPGSYAASRMTILTGARQPLSDLSQIPGMSLLADRPSDFGCPCRLSRILGTKPATEEIAMHHPATSYELAQAALADRRRPPQRDAGASTAPEARRRPGRLNVDDTRSQALFASSLQPPAEKAMQMLAMLMTARSLSAADT